MAAVVAVSGSIKALEEVKPFILLHGRTQAVIVGNDNMVSCVETGYKTAPNFLSTYIKKSTGRTIKTIAEKDYDPKKHPYAIFLHDTKAAKEKYSGILKCIDRDSYIVSVTSNKAYIIGARRHSFYYGMADFLYSYLRIATYIPAKWGTIVPKHKAELSQF
ncbi:MAG: hypothetical protein ACYTFY_23565 [Planctomycetota bacterium]|jgi:hypothetical protein